MIESSKKELPISPIIQRELRAAARQVSSYRLRLVGAIASTVVAGALLQDTAWASNPSQVGMRLFGSLHTVLLAGIWLLVPALTADCLSRERREGTLGLLFMTSLTSREIVTGKSWVQISRALTLWAAALPVLTTSFVIGALGWLDVASAFSLQVMAMALALSAGLIASSLTTNVAASVMIAEVLSLGSFRAVQEGVLRPLCVFVIGSSPAGAMGGAIDADSAVTSVLSGSFRDGETWSVAFALPPVWARHVWIGFLPVLVLLGVAALALASRVAAWRVESFWQDKPLSVRQTRRRNFWLTPRFWTTRFARRRSDMLNRNPLGWLEHYNARQRITRLGWCLAILLVDSLLVMRKDPWTFFEFAQMWMALLFSLNLAFAAAALFQQERETGALELLLVTPMRPNELIFARLRAYWRRFFAPVALFIGLGELIVGLDMASHLGFNFSLFVLVNYLTAPVLGFCCSLRWSAVAGAFFAVASVGVGGPVIVRELSLSLISHLTPLDWPWFFGPYENAPGAPVGLDGGIRFAQLVLAATAFFVSRRTLERREFITPSKIVALGGRSPIRIQPA